MEPKRRRYGFRLEKGVRGSNSWLIRIRLVRNSETAESGMSAEKSFYVVREPEWTVVVDTDKEFDARLVAL